MSLSESYTRAVYTISIIFSWYTKVLQFLYSEDIPMPLMQKLCPGNLFCNIYNLLFKIRQIFNSCGFKDSITFSSLPIIHLKYKKTWFKSFVLKLFYNLCPHSPNQPQTSNHKHPADFEF